MVMSFLLSLSFHECRRRGRRELIGRAVFLVVSLPATTSGKKKKLNSRTVSTRPASSGCRGRPGSVLRR
jgi:hypothetical protein